MTYTKDGMLPTDPVEANLFKGKESLYLVISWILYKRSILTLY